MYLFVRDQSVREEDYLIGRATMLILLSSQRELYTNVRSVLIANHLGILAPKRKIAFKMLLLHPQHLDEAARYHPDSVNDWHSGHIDNSVHLVQSVVTEMFVCALNGYEQLEAPGNCHEIIHKILPYLTEISEDRELSQGLVAFVDSTMRPVLQRPPSRTGGTC